MGMKLMQRFRALTLVVPVAAIVALVVACTPSGDVDPGFLSGLAGVLLLLPLWIGFTALGARGGNGSFGCIGFVCQIF
jgi:hypothetical protein